MKTISGLLACISLLAFTPIQAATVVVNNDEWTLADLGFSNAPDTTQFVLNIASSFSNGGTGTFHAYSNNFGLTQSMLSNTLTGAGHSYTSGTGFAFTLANISGFDALFLAGDFLDEAGIAVLIDYVDMGGNVYLAGGTGITPSAAEAAAEAAAWNPFLNTLGMSFNSTYNNISQNVDTTGATHPLFAGVSALFQASGSTITGSGIVVSLNGQGLYAVSPVPIPATVWLFGSALGLLGWIRRKAT